MDEANRDTRDFAPGDIIVGLGLLTRLPLPVAADQAVQRGARAAWSYPVVGLVVAGAGLLAVLLAEALGLPAVLCPILAVAAMVLVTGAMHEDGLADCADGFWGGWDRARRLDIMKDSQIGTYGVLALILSQALRIAALGVLLAHGGWVGLLIAAATGRAAMVAVMHRLPHARAGGLSASVGQPGQRTTGMALALAAVLTLALWPTAILAVALAATGITFGSAALARAKIGGQTGDVLGATEQAVEIGVLMALAALVA